MAELNPYIFRAYDVRGKVGIDITPPVFELVGRAYGTLVKRRGGARVALGMDNRTSSRRSRRRSRRGCCPPGSTWWTSASITRPSSTSRPRTGSWTAAPPSPAATIRSPTTGSRWCTPGAAPLTEKEIQGLLATIKAGDFERGAGARDHADPRDEYLDDDHSGS